MLFRSCAARAICLRFDRPDLAYATKELCRRTRVSIGHDLQILRRMAPYFRVSPRLVYRFAWRWGAGVRFALVCKCGRLLAHGGCIIYGEHLV